MVKRILRIHVALAMLFQRQSPGNRFVNPCPVGHLLVQLCVFIPRSDSRYHVFPGSERTTHQKGNSPIILGCENPFLSWNCERAGSCSSSTVVQTTEQFADGPKIRDLFLGEALWPSENWRMFRACL